MTEDQAKQLRKAFDEKQIGQIPKGGQMLDFVGHAAVTDRLLQVDPEWTWRPMARNSDGFPLFDASGGLWIWLTIGDVTRPGYGEPGKIGPKEAIGDALRNAAMRFGVALDLWSKQDLDDKPASGEATVATPEQAVDLLDPNTLRNLRGAYLGLKSLVGEKEATAFIAEMLGGIGLTKFEELSKAQGEACLATLELHRVQVAESVPA
jgi:hypothetical protein